MPRDESAQATTSGSPRSATAYDQLLPEILAVPEKSLSPILIDIPTAVTTVLGVLPRIRALRPEIAETLRKSDFERFDRLEQYALALIHAHDLHRVTQGSKPSLGGTIAELIAIRKTLLRDARSLASHGLLSAERLVGCSATPGHRALACDVLMLVELLRKAWSSVHDQTPVTLAELDQAAVLAERLLAAVGLRDQAALTVAQATMIRRKAFALFIRAYAQARAAGQYLRARLGDTDQIAPSLYAGRVKKRTAAAADEPGVDPDTAGLRR